MSTPVIRVEHLSKDYRLGTISSGTLSRDLNMWWAKLRGKSNPYATLGENGSFDTAIHQALNDVNFEIHQGEAVGIIGKNGAGKSTLLKILSRVTTPTSGRIRVKGRIASLLEVGTGFHPELTGRENIFLNGAILGMSKSEIKLKLDEIISFSGVEEYIDTPVKRYSSGMYVRLAFAVAAHLESEILILDEVLAVGDAEFQKKCLGKMSEVSKNYGRTVLFVSHNMAAVKQLCTKGVVLKSGVVVFEGNQHDAVGFYQNSGNTDSYFEHQGEIDSAPGNDHIRILKFEVNPTHGPTISISSGLTFEITFLNLKENINLDVTFELKTIDEIAVFHHGTLISTKKDSKRGIYKVKGELPPNLLNSGIFKFKLIFGEDQRYALLIKDDFIQFEILNEAKGSNSSQLPGLLFYKISYAIEFKEQLINV